MGKALGRSAAIKSVFYLSLLLLLSGQFFRLAAQVDFSALQTITAAELKKHVFFLADDKLEGRMTGSKGCKKAARYIADFFRRCGLKPMGDKGSYFQKFEVALGVKLGTENELTITQGRRRQSYKVKQDFIPLGFSASGGVVGELVFAGYGITAPEANYDDYAGVDVKDKAVLLLRHEPREKADNSPFGRFPSRYSDLRYKAQNAREHGALAMLFVTDPNNHEGEDDALYNFERSSPFSQDAGIPVLHLKRSIAEGLFKQAGKDLREVQRNLDETLKSQSFAFSDVRVRLRTDVQKIRGSTANVIGLLPGTDPKLKEEVIVIGAHYDHIGYGGASSGSTAPDQKAIHNGADDNASGTAGLLELAKAFAKEPNRKRSLLFIAFSAEERGLLGSRHYVDHPVFPLEKTKAMLNMDMIGRLKEKLMVFGTGTAKEFEEAIKKANVVAGLNVDMHPQGQAPSDHLAFLNKKRPALQFFTGAHPDYHKPSDDADKLNYEGMEKIVRFIFSVTKELLNSDAEFQFVEVPTDPHAGMAVAPGDGMPALGIIPDYSFEGIGVRIDSVRPGGPADKAGLKEGDVIISFAGKKVRDVQEYTNLLFAKKAGDEVEVVVLRGKQELKVKAKLELRR